MPVWNMHERYGDASTDGIYGRDHGVPERRGWPPGANLSERDAHHRSLFFFFFFFLLLRLMCCPLILVRNISLMLLPSCSSRPLLCLGSLFFPSPHLSFMNAQTINNRGRSVVLGCGAVPSFFFFLVAAQADSALCDASEIKTEDEGEGNNGPRATGNLWPCFCTDGQIPFRFFSTHTHTHIHTCMYTRWILGSPFLSDSCPIRSSYANPARPVSLAAIPSASNNLCPSGFQRQKLYEFQYSSVGAPPLSYLRWLNE